MQMAQDTMTIYNRYSAGREGDRWTRTVICGVSWHKSAESTLTSAGFVSAEVHRIRIPVTAAAEQGKTYVPASEFAGADKEMHWTVRLGDKVVRGVADIPADDVDLDTRLETEYEDAANVTGFADNRRGNPCGQHWRIEAV